MTDNVTHSTSEQSGGNSVLSQLEVRLETEILKTLGDETSPLRAADLYLRMGSSIAAVIGEVLDRLADEGKVARGDNGLFWRAAEESSIEENPLPVKAESLEIVSEEVPPAPNDGDLYNEPAPSSADEKVDELSDSSGAAFRKAEGVPFQAGPLSDGRITFEREGRACRVSLENLTLSRLFFRDILEKAAFLRLLDYPTSVMMNELPCRYRDVSVLVSKGLARELGMFGIERVRRRAQTDPAWVAERGTPVAWAASLFSEDRKLLSALFMGKRFESAAHAAGVSERTAAKILRESLGAFPQLERLADDVPADERPAGNPENSSTGVTAGKLADDQDDSRVEPSNEDPRVPSEEAREDSAKALANALDEGVREALSNEEMDETSGDELALLGREDDVAKVDLGPFAFDDKADAVMFLRSLGATPRQVCDIMGVDSERYGTLLSQGNERWRIRKREGRGNSRVDLCAWASDLRRSDARLVLLSLMDEDPRKICAETSYTLHGLDVRFAEILETAPFSRHHEEHLVGAQDVQRSNAVPSGLEGEATERTGDQGESTDCWPLGLRGVGERGLFLALLGALPAERSRILGESPARLDEEIRSAALGDPEISNAFISHSDGRYTLVPSVIDRGVYESGKNLMVWASRLSSQEKSILLAWLEGEDEQHIAYQRIHTTAENVRATLRRLLAHFKPWTCGLRRTEPGLLALKREQTVAGSCSSEPISLAQWLASLDEVARGALLALFSCGRVSEFAVRNGIETKVARRAFQEAIQERPTLLEDRYLYLYETYKVSAEDFTELTGLGSESYGYLKYVSGRGSGYRLLKPGALNDEKLPREVLERLRSEDVGIASSGLLRIDGQLVRLTLGGLVRHFGSVRAQTKPMSIYEFCAAFRDFTNGLELGDRKDLQLPENPQTAAQTLAKTGSFLVASLKHVRYYDFDAHDFSPLVDILRAGIARNVECSSRIVFTANRTLMETLDLVDEYDLYVVIKRLLKEASISGVATGKCPILRLGECDRHAQVLEVIKEASPASADEVAAIYEERYGVPVASFKSSYLREFAAYQRSGRYEYHERELSDDMREFLGGELKGDYLVLSLVQARFAARFSQASRLDVNDATLAPFGYHTSHELIVRDGIDVRSVFGELIDTHEQFALGDVGFDEAIIKYPVFRAELRARLASLSYVEWMRDHYLSVARLSSAFDVGRDELRAYMGFISELAEPGVPFTVPGLLRAGRRHPLDALRDDAGVEDSLYEGLIEAMPTSEGIKRTSFDGTIVYCRVHGSFSTAEFLSYLACREGHIEIEDLIDLLEDEYGIDTSVGYVRNCIERAASEGLVFHNKALDTLLPSKEANAAFVRSCIDRT